MSEQNTASFEITDKEINAFVDEVWDDFLEDASRLIAIDSSLDSEHASERAPFGPGPRKALDEILSIANRLGYETNDGDGYAGYADLPGETNQQLGVIGHVDVVPAGIGWTFEPFALTRKEGVLIGRGTADDKVPLLSALYAGKFWLDRAKGQSDPTSHAPLHHAVRFIFGCNEETGMADVPYYRAHHNAPDFLFTPDADFPLCYGEKGLFGVTLTREISEDAVISFDGGVATNAVPALACAVVSVSPEEVSEALKSFTDAGRISFEVCSEGVRISATGVSGHASLPEGTVNAVAILARFLEGLPVCSAQECEWFGWVAKLAESIDGSAAGIAVSDEDFGSLTSVVGTLHKEGSSYILTDDIRFPTAITGAELERAFIELGDRLGASVEITRNQEPFVVNPNTAPVQALMDAYKQSTGLEVHPFTMGGATYAREFPHAVSFGPADPEVIKGPDWVGEMHGADEGVTEEAVKHAMRIYIRAFGNLAQVENLALEKL